MQQSLERNDVAQRVSIASTSDYLSDSFCLKMDTASKETFGSESSRLREMRDQDAEYRVQPRSKASCSEIV